MTPLLSPERMHYAAKRWTLGEASKSIASALGISDKQFQDIRCRNRDKFPKFRRDNKTRLYVYLTLDTYEKLGRASLRKSMTKSAYIRYLIKKEPE